MFLLYKCMHQRKSNPIKWKLYVNKANLNLSWMLLSSIPAGAMFSEWFRWAYMDHHEFIYLSIRQCAWIGHIVNSVCTTNGHWSTFQEKCLLSLVQAHWSSPKLQQSLSHHLLPCSNGFSSSLTWQPWNGSFLFWTKNLRVLAEANSDAGIQTS